MLNLPPFGDFSFMAKIALTASGAVAISFTLKKLAGFSSGIETKKLSKALSAAALIFVSGAAVNEITRAK